MNKVSFVAFLIFFISSAAFSSIYDGGTFSAKKVTQSVDVKPLGPDLAPEPSRFSSAPLGQTMYVIGEDKKCYWGSFSKSQDKTVLIVYYSSPVTSEHCVYQSDFSPNPTGYSLWVKGGGRCVSSHADVEGEKYDWVVKVDEAELQIKDCFKPGASYGDVIDKKHHKSTAVAEAVAPAAREVVKSGPEIVKAVTEEIRGPSSVAKTGYTLQFSSHLSEEEAQNVVKSFKGNGVDAYISQAEVDGKARYRVCVGHFPTTKLAREFQHKLPSSIDSKNAFVQVLK